MRKALIVVIYNLFLTSLTPVAARDAAKCAKKIRIEQ